MADEWSKPVKQGTRWAASLAGARTSAMLDPEGLWVASHPGGYAALAPRDVVLRLLAAEASDRLGWVWEVGVDEFTGQLAAGRVDWPVLWLAFPDGSIASEANCSCPDTPDELLAAMHGQFLLLDALREAGQ